LPAPFFVIATQNPVEQEGTYPLPEAQLDRFMFNLRVDYPSHDEEVRILIETTGEETKPLEKIWTGADMLALQRVIRRVPVAPSVAEYAVTLVQATRAANQKSPDFIRRYVQWGAGPRASQYLALAGKVFAVLDGRFNVAKEDIRSAAKLVLRHRLITNYRAEADKQTADTIIDRLLETIK
jgi:MoxR-like ATPase